ncbi:hypothetical protein C8Q74DRAFT_1371897 [Fomes fomentarius]|nr:hypothetical protein C8Q74DRAFT_1371897 [Fomes fomentarius]
MEISSAPSENTGRMLSSLSLNSVHHVLLGVDTHILYATDAAEIATPDEAGRLRWLSTRVVLAELSADTRDRSSCTLHWPISRTIPGLSAIIDEHFWYALDEAEGVVSITLFSCSQAPDSTRRGHYALRFQQLLDYSEFARLVVNAKTEIDRRQALLSQRLAELFAIQYTYSRITSTPSLNEERAPIHLASIAVQTGTSVRDEDGELSVYNPPSSSGSASDSPQDE